MVSNYRTVCTLNFFPKIYENVIKDKLVNSMKGDICPFTSACRKNYNTQYDILKLLRDGEKIYAIMK